MHCEVKACSKFEIERALRREWRFCHVLDLLIFFMKIDSLIAFCILENWKDSSEMNWNFHEFPVTWKAKKALKFPNQKKYKSVQHSNEKKYNENCLWKRLKKKDCTQETLKIFASWNLFSSLLYDILKIFSCVLSSRDSYTNRMNQENNIRKEIKRE